MRRSNDTLLQALYFTVHDMNCSSDAGPKANYFGLSRYRHREREIERDTETSITKGADIDFMTQVAAESWPRSRSWSWPWSCSSHAQHKCGMFSRRGSGSTAWNLKNANPQRAVQSRER